MSRISIIARVAEPEHARRNARRENATSDRYERRTETCFRTDRGWLILRESDTRHELAAIVNGKEHPVRHKPDNPRALKEVLLAALGIPVIAEMRRETFHLHGADVHFDDVEALGSFVEIEAIDAEETSEAVLRARCHDTLKLLGIPESDIALGTYADLLSD